MSSPESAAGSQPPNGAVDAASRPMTPVENNATISSSQATLPSTEGPGSPMDPSASFKTETNDDRLDTSAIIPSSLTPPPSSQMPGANGATAAAGAAVTAGLSDFLAPNRSSILSPPITGLSNSRREVNIGGSDYTVPSPSQVIEASADDLRSMMQSCLAEHARLKMEAAHHKLQHQLLCIQSDEDAKRAAVEQDMVQREIEALRAAEHSRQARRELSSATESLQAKYYQLKMWYDEVIKENETLNKRLKVAKKIIQQKEEEIIGLSDDKELLLNRLKENREHFHLLCSPGGLFHGALTPKTQASSTPVQNQRQTPRQTPKSAQQSHHSHQHRDGGRADREHNSSEAPFAALLQVLSQENNSAPSTPTTAHRPAPRISSKHTRNVQSMSSLPTTPAPRPSRGGDYGGLLPSANLVPQTEPPHRYGGRAFVPETPVRASGRRSRESTISAEDNEELARQALQSVASAAQSFAAAAASSRASHQSGGSSSRRINPHPGDEEEEEVFESQASQAASEMLRRDPRESFEVASSAGGSRDGTPAPAEKSARLQAKLFAGVGKAGLAAAEKRKFSGGPIDTTSEDTRRDAITSPTKKLRLAGGLRDGRVGLGIQYGQEA